MPFPPLALPIFQALLPRLDTALPLTVPLRLLVAVALETLNALSNEPVEPLFSATERWALALAAPERLFILLSERVLVVVVVVVLLLLRLRVLLSERVSVAVLLLSRLRMLLSERVSVAVLLAVLLLSLVLLLVLVRERLSLVVFVAVLLLSLVLLSVRERLSLVVLVAVLLLSLVLLSVFCGVGKCHAADAECNCHGRSQECLFHKASYIGMELDQGLSCADAIH